MQSGDQVASRFTIERLAGSGGMGAVYRAIDSRTGAPVALKVLHGRGMLEPERFLRESRVLSELAHPGIVRYVDHGTTESGDLYLAMEWVEGEDLQVRLARAPLSVGETVLLLTRVSEALAVAHAQKIIHRDIKPGNLLLLGGTIDGVKLLDFGIARIDSDTQTATSVDTTLGTPEYMAPEQARGARDLDARADIFSLGCVIYECLTGRPAFSGSHLMALLARVLLEEAPRVRELRPEVPEALDALVMRMLAKDPEGRPADASALRADVAALDSLPAATLDLVPAARTLTKAERRLLSVVLARAAVDVGPGDANAATLVAGATLPTLTSHRAAVQAYGGTLERLADGTLIATLTGTGAATDQAMQAARCALAMRAIAPLAPMALATGRGDVSLRGPVGEVLERAAHLLRADMRADRKARVAPPDAPAQAGTRVPIRIDDVTAGLLDARFDVGGDARGLELRGEREVFEPTRTLLGRESPCIGRERELGMLEALWDECASEPVAHAVLVTGAAGVGKSRLRFELMHRIMERTGPVQAWMARGDPMGAASPFGLLGRALRRAAGLLDGEPLDVRQRKLRARVARYVNGAELTRVTEFLGELVGTPFSGEKSVQLRAARQDAMLMGDQMRRAWEDFVRAECETEPLLVVLEDLHWGDLPTVSFIDAALRNLADRPLMILALARPEVHECFPRLWSGRPVTHIQLDKLTKKASEKLVRAFLGPEFSAETVAKLVERAAGNAFYLEELIRSVASGKGEDLPETVLAMVEARLEAFEPEVRRVVRAAAVFGQVFWLGGVRALLGDDERVAKIAPVLDELIDKEVVARRGQGKFPGEDEYIFRHAMLRDAALAMLTPADRELGHRLAAEWLEKAGEGDAIVLAEHFERGGQPARAIAFYRRGAEQAIGGNDLELALARAERGIRCGAEGEMLGALRLLQAEAHRWRGESEDEARTALEAMAALPQKSAPWFTAASEAAVAASRRGDFGPARSFRELLEEGAPGDVQRAQCIAAAWVSLPLFSGGAYAEAIDLLATAQRTAGDLWTTDPTVAGWMHRALAIRASFEGDSGRFLEHAERAAACFEEAGDVRNACLQRSSAGSAYCELGAYADAEPALRGVIASAERLGIPNVVAAAQHVLGRALARTGKLGEARAAEEYAVEAFKGRTYPRMEGASRAYLADILVASGKLDQAEAHARAAAELLLVSPAAHVYALGMLARVQLAKGLPVEALVTAKDAVDKLESLGGIEEGEAMVRLAYAEALHAKGEHAAAKTEILAARDRLLTRAQKIEDARWRTSFLSAVPEHARTLALAEDWS